MNTAPCFDLRRSGPVSRILSWMIIYLGPRSPGVSCGLTRATAGPALTAPIRPCSGWGLPSRHVTVTLVRSYRTVSAFPLYKTAESSFLWHFPSGHPALPLAGTLPCGVRTFLTGLEGPRDHPAHSSNILAGTRPHGAVAGVYHTPSRVMRA